MFIKKLSSREKLLQNNHKNISRPKNFNKNTDAYNTAPPWAEISFHWPKFKSVSFEEPYDNINPMENNHENTNLVDTQEQNIKYTEVEQEELFEYMNKNLITEEELEHIHP